jgi:hypothetical protein
MGGQRSGRADRAPGRCQAGEGVAWRHNLTGRFFFSAVQTASVRRQTMPVLANLLEARMFPTMRNRRSNPLMEFQKKEKCRKKGKREMNALD